MFKSCWQHKSRLQLGPSSHSLPLMGRVCLAIWGKAIEQEKILACLSPIFYFPGDQGTSSWNKSEQLRRSRRVSPQTCLGQVQVGQSSSRRESSACRTWRQGQKRALFAPSCFSLRHPMCLDCGQFACRFELVNTLNSQMRLSSSRGRKTASLRIWQ